MSEQPGAAQSLSNVDTRAAVLCFVELAVGANAAVALRRGAVQEANCLSVSITSRKAEQLAEIPVGIGFADEVPVAMRAPAGRDEDGFELAD